MDPDAALERLRELAARAQETGGSVYVAELAEVFEGLDAWLTDGGFLPKAWKR